MFEKLKQYWRDAQTIKDLSVLAEGHAREEGEQHPSAEHYILAALDLQEGSARRVLERLGADPRACRTALLQRHASALATLGLVAGSDVQAPAVPPRPAVIFDAKPSGQALMQALPELRRKMPAPLCGAHVLLAAAAMTHSAAMRALAAAGIESQALSQAAEAELIA